MVELDILNLCCVEATNVLNKAATAGFEDSGAAAWDNRIEKSCPQVAAGCLIGQQLLTAVSAVKHDTPQIRLSLRGAEHLQVEVSCCEMQDKVAICRTQGCAVVSVDHSVCITVTALHCKGVSTAQRMHGPTFAFLGVVLSRGGGGGLGVLWHAGGLPTVHLVQAPLIALLVTPLHQVLLTPATPTTHISTGNS